ncbi:MAG TPA: hypothetical protein VFL82_08100, partial [Thermomicrobiales bacterium]|nr:hypothetical protein [Thermomicrobiales bacterium]
ELWDTASSNLVGTYPTEHAALTIVRNAVTQHGPEALRTIALGKEDESGELQRVTVGDELIRMALDAEPQRSSRVRRTKPFPRTCPRIRVSKREKHRLAS